MYSVILGSLLAPRSTAVTLCGQCRVWLILHGARWGCSVSTSGFHIGIYHISVKWVWEYMDQARVVFHSRNVVY